MESPQIRQAQFDLFDTARFFELIEKVRLQERDFRLIVAAVAEAESSWNISYIADCANVLKSLIFYGFLTCGTFSATRMTMTSDASGRKAEDARTSSRRPEIWRRSKPLRKAAISNSAPCYNMGHE